MRLPLRSDRRRLTLALAIGAAVLLSAGCARMGKVSGKVTLPDGSPLPGGIITFTPEDTSRNPATAVIHEDGTYEADVPTGTCKVGIDNRMAGQSHTPVGLGAMPVPDPGAAKGAAPAAPKGAPNSPSAIMAKMKGGGPGGGPAPKENKSGMSGLARAAEAAGAPKGGPITPVPGKVVPINSKYYTPEGSGLTVHVGGGTNTFDVTLEK
jgi:hypothetical protein